MTIHVTLADMTEPEIFEEDAMARRISPRDIVRANLEGHRAKKIVAVAIEMGDGRWGAQFAVPGKVPDYTRDGEGNVITYGSEFEAAYSAMDAAIRLFNMPRDHLRRFGQNRIGSAETGTIRPVKMTPAEMSAAMSAAGLNSSDLVFLLDKPAKRILDWSNGGDIPHEVRLLLDTWAKYDETVDFAFDVTNAAREEAEQG